MWTPHSSRVSRKYWKAWCLFFVHNTMLYFMCRWWKCGLRPIYCQHKINSKIKVCNNVTTCRKSWHTITANTPCLQVNVAQKRPINNWCPIIWLYLLQCVVLALAGIDDVRRLHFHCLFHESEEMFLIHTWWRVDVRVNLSEKESVAIFGVY